MMRKHWSVIRALQNEPRVLERFWKLVERTHGDDACWEWTGPVKPGGYPSFRIGCRSVAASHVMWFIVVGDLPEGGRVKKTCGNCRCVRPNHLVWALRPVLERAVASLNDGYVPVAGHASLRIARAVTDTRVLRSAVGGAVADAADETTHEAPAAA